MSVFRKAFVELTEAAFEAAKQLGEATVEAIVERARVREVQIESLNAKHDRVPHWVYNEMIGHIRPTWHYYDTFRDAYDRVEIVRVTLPYRHRGEIHLDEAAIVQCRDIDYIARKLAEAPQRRCYCVHQEPQGARP